MSKIFLDSDVILDLLLDRVPYSNDIQTLIEYSIDSETKLFTSPISICNINYIIARIENKKQADFKTKKILELISIENVGQKTVDEASSSKFKDFEDSIQNFCAIESGHEIIITRNTKDYKESRLSILTPREYLAKVKSK